MKKEEQLELIPKKPTRGGTRSGAGRKPKRKTVVMRVPERYKPSIEHLIQFLDSIDKGEAVTSHGGMSISKANDLTLEFKGSGIVTVLFESRS